MKNREYLEGRLNVLYNKDMNCYLLHRASYVGKIKMHRYMYDGVSFDSRFPPEYLGYSFRYVVGIIDQKEEQRAQARAIEKIEEKINKESIKKEKARQKKKRDLEKEAIRFNESRIIEESVFLGNGRNKTKHIVNVFEYLVPVLDMLEKNQPELKKISNIKNIGELIKKSDFSDRVKQQALKNIVSHQPLCAIYEENIKWQILKIKGVGKKSFKKLLALARQEGEYEG